MTFNPLLEKGARHDKQVKKWDRPGVAPHDNNEVCPLMPTLILLMNGTDGRRQSEEPHPAAEFRARETIRA
jgi:hypothetical protein